MRRKGLTTAGAGDYLAQGELIPGLGSGDAPQGSLFCSAIMYGHELDTGKDDKEFGPHLAGHKAGRIVLINHGLNADKASAVRLEGRYAAPACGNYDVSLTDKRPD